MFFFFGFCLVHLHFYLLFWCFSIGVFAMEHFVGVTGDFSLLILAIGCFCGDKTECALLLSLKYGGSIITVASCFFVTLV